MILRPFAGALVLSLIATFAPAAPVVFDTFNEDQVVIGPGTAGQPANFDFFTLNAPNAALIRTITVDFGAPDDIIEVDSDENGLIFQSPITSTGGVTGSVVWSALSPFSLDALGDKLVFTVQDLTLEPFYGSMVLSLTLEDSTSATDSVTIVDTFGLTTPLGQPLLPAPGTQYEILNSFWGVDTTSLSEVRFEIFSEPFGALTLGAMSLEDEEVGDPLFLTVSPTPVPLPAGVWLMGAGLGALALRRKRAA